MGQGSSPYHEYKGNKRGSICSHEINILLDNMLSTNAKQVHVMPSEDELLGAINLSVVISPS